MHLVPALRNQLQEYVNREWLPSKVQREPVYAVVHLTPSRVEKLHGVLMYQVIDDRHCAVIAQRAYRWINVVGWIVTGPTRLRKCRLCDSRIAISNELPPLHITLS